MENLVALNRNYQNIQSTALLATDTARPLCTISPRNWAYLFGLAGAPKKPCALHGVSCPRFSPATHMQPQ